MICCFGLLVISSASGNETVRIDARDYPFSAIGRLNLGGSGFCSAVLVGPDLVLSAASCLYNRTEGRWWGRKELFFQGGYQFENAGNQAGIAAYAAPRSYRPDGRLTLTSAHVNFALLKLERPIGNDAGWLGMRWNDDALANRLRTHSATIHHAGYARDRQHVQVVDAGCNVVAGACTLTPQRLSLRPLVEHGGGFYALLPRFKTGARSRAKLRRITSNLLKRLGYAFPDTPAPNIGKLKPTRTVALLLRHLGYVSGRPAALASVRLTQGIKAFQKDIGRRPDGQVNLRLLGDVMRATRAGGGHSDGRTTQRSLGELVRASGRGLR